MLKCKNLVLLILLSFCQLSCSQNESLFNESKLLEHVKILSSDTFEGRKTDTEGSKKARTYIIKAFQILGVKPLDVSFEQAFSFTYENRSYKGINILGAIEGTEYPEEYIVITAHYDHLGIQNNKIYNGADDNASGVSALIAFAEYFKKHPPQHSVILAAFDAEELGLEGSKYYINNPIVTLDKLVCNVNMDMISRSEEDELFIVGSNRNEVLKNACIKVKELSKKIKLTFAHDGSDGSDGLEDWTDASDHSSFYKKQIPFLYFGVADHKDYHKYTDDYINIHPEFYKEAVHQIILVFNEIDMITF